MAAGVVVEVVVVREAEVNNITQQSRNQSSADKGSGMWPVTGDDLLVIRHTPPFLKRGFL